MGKIFTDCQIVIEFPNAIRFKDKKETKDAIIRNGGVISYIVSRKATHLVLSSSEQLGSYKCKQANKLGIPILSIKWIDACLTSRNLEDVDSFLLEKSLSSKQFEKGKITVPTLQKKANKFRMTLTPSSVSVFNGDEKDCPRFPSNNFDVIKWNIFSKQDNKNGSFFVVLELDNDIHSTVEFPFRVSCYSGWEQALKRGDIGKAEHRFLQKPKDALSIYAHLHDMYIGPSHKMTEGKLPTTGKLGSAEFLKCQIEEMQSVDGLDINTSMLMENIWYDALGCIESNLAIKINQVKIEQIDKAEEILYQIKDLLSFNIDKDNKLTDLTQSYYQVIPHKRNEDLTKKMVAKEIDLCQVLRDVVAVGESTGWSTECSPLSKYRALKCAIEHMSDEKERIKIINHVLDSQHISSGISVKNVFSIHRAKEHSQFTNKVENKRLIFHSSSGQNMVGILSRGLLLPKMVVSDYGGSRTDAGKLGCGIYFSNSASTASKYSSPLNKSGTRMMFVTEVAMGNVLDLDKIDESLTSAPSGYDCVHGVRSTAESSTDFLDDEFVIYNTNQQRLKYLVEFSLPGDNVYDDYWSDLTNYSDDMTMRSSSEVDYIDTNDVLNIPDPLDKVEAGLRGSGNAPVPLVSVHIRGKLMDLAAQVVVMQEYYNKNNSAIEAKYVFPLDEMAAVCGFEAFINDKHIIGQVKEKEEAHREYKEAISKGHGAYLMDEEKPDVFTVNVGNLPPKANVLIKITYVCELSMDGDVIRFALPGSVAPWEKDPNLGQITQDTVDVITVGEDKSVNTTLQLSVDMPFDINMIKSPTHMLKMKKTATKAVVELPKNSSLGNGFQLLIGLSEVHVPRMWVENHPEKDHQACMLTFYPEFDFESRPDATIILMIDMSNSMAGQSASDAIKVAKLALVKIPDSCFFNIIAFGTSHKESFPQSKKKTKSSVAVAMEFLNGLTATMGNTYMERPLNCQSLLTSDDETANVLLISDGHLSSQDTLLAFIKNNSLKLRVFSAGVGSVANHHLLKRIALQGAGSYEFYDSSTKSKWESKIMTQLDHCQQPSLNNVNVEWKQYDDNAIKPVQAPNQITSIFSGRRQVIYGFVPNCTEATLHAEIQGNQVKTSVSTAELNIKEGTILHTLTARALIRDWENGILHHNKLQNEILKEDKKNWVIDLSKEYSIVTKFTSFVAIEERDKDEEFKKGKSQAIEDLVTAESVDILDYMGWQVAPPEIEDLETKVERLLDEAKLAENSSLIQSLNVYGQLEALAPVLNANEKYESARTKIASQLKQFYLNVSVNEEKAKNVYNCFNVIPISVLRLGGESLSVSVSSDTTVAELKMKILDILSSTDSPIRLVLKGAGDLNDDMTMSDYGILDETELLMVLRLRGGFEEKDPPCNIMDAVADGDSSDSDNDDEDEEGWSWAGEESYMGERVTDLLKSAECEEESSEEMEGSGGGAEEQEEEEEEYVLYDACMEESSIESTSRSSSSRSSASPSPMICYEPTSPEVYLQALDVTKAIFDPAPTLKEVSNVMTSAVDPVMLKKKSSPMKAEPQKKIYDPTIEDAAELEEDECFGLFDDGKKKKKKQNKKNISNESGDAEDAERAFDMFGSAPIKLQQQPVPLGGPAIAASHFGEVASKAGLGGINKTQVSAFSFGSQPASSGLFGGPPAPSGTFGSQPASSGLFGGPPAPSGTFGSQPASSGLFGSQPASSNAFGSLQTEPVAFQSFKGTSNEFGSPQTSMGKFGKQQGAALPPPGGFAGYAAPPVLLSCKGASESPRAETIQIELMEDKQVCSSVSEEPRKPQPPCDYSSYIKPSKMNIARNTLTSLEPGPLPKALPQDDSFIQEKLKQPSVKSASKKSVQLFQSPRRRIAPRPLQEETSTLPPPPCPPPPAFECVTHSTPPPPPAVQKEFSLLPTSCPPPPALERRSVPPPPPPGARRDTSILLPTSCPPPAALNRRAAPPPKPPAARRETSPLPPTSCPRPASRGRRGRGGKSMGFPPVSIYIAGNAEPVKMEDAEEIVLEKKKGLKMKKKQHRLIRDSPCSHVQENDLMIDFNEYYNPWLKVFEPKHISKNDLINISILVANMKSSTDREMVFLNKLFNDVGAKSLGLVAVEEITILIIALLILLRSGLTPAQVHLLLQGSNDPIRDIQAPDIIMSEIKVYAGLMNKYAGWYNTLELARSLDGLLSQMMEAAVISI